MTCGRLYLENTLLERLAPHVEDMPAELRELIQQEDAMVGQRHLPWHRHLPAADHAHLGNGLVEAAEGARRDDGCTPAGEASDAVEAQCRDTTGCRFGVRLEGTQFRTPASLARLTLLGGVALGRWTAVGQAAASKAPRVRPVCKRQGPRLSLLRAGIQFGATLALLAYLGVRFIRAHLPLPSSAAFPGSKLLRRSHERAKRSAIQQSLSPSQKRHPTSQTR